MKLLLIGLSSDELAPGLFGIGTENDETIVGVKSLALLALALLVEGSMYSVS